jgi:recombination protein RecA
MTNSDILAKINKEIGDPHALVMGDSPTLIPEFLPTGIRPFDRILGGGLRKGSLVAITGEFSSGKSLLTQMFIKAAQDEGIDCAYLDTEHAYNQDWMQASGVDISRLLVSQVVRGEKAFNIIHALVRAGIGLIIVDSMTALITESRAEAEMEQKFVGQKALLINTGIEKLLDVLQENQSKAVVVAISQLRSNVGGHNPMETEIMAGGRGLGHYAHLVLRVRRAGWETKKSTNKAQKYPVKTGYTMEIETRKSKQSAPFQKVRIPVSFATQMDAVAAIVYEALDLGLIAARGSYFDVGAKDMIQGRSKLLAYAREHPEWVEKIAIAVETAEENSGGIRTDDASDDTE